MLVLFPLPAERLAEMKALAPQLEVVCRRPGDPDYDAALAEAHIIVG